MRILLLTTLAWMLASPAASAMMAERDSARPGRDATELVITQRGCMSLSQAIESVRRQGNVERIISAETKVSGGQETHHIKVQTKDGRVRTHRVPGCRR